MKAKVYFSTILFSLLMIGCYIDLDDKICIEGNGKVMSEERILRSFSKIELQCDANVILRQGKGQEVFVDAQENILDELITDSRNGVLYIQTDKCIRRYEQIIIYITLPFIESLKISGSGSIMNDGAIQTDEIELSIPGSGEININSLNAQFISSRISGSGRIYLYGDEIVKQHNISISGSGSMKANSLSTESVDIDITGSGSIWIKATKVLNADIMGSGSVYYKGNPTITSKITGSGQIKNDN
jgi:hypothetical protein